MCPLIDAGVHIKYYEQRDDCCRQHNGAPKILLLMPGACECVTSHGKRGFADVIKDLETERGSWIVWVAPCNHKSPHNREARESKSERDILALKMEERTTNQRNASSF